MITVGEITKTGKRQALHLLDEVEQIRLRASTLLERDSREGLAQFMTPAPVAALMARMIGDFPKDVRLLDAGAGCGSLFAAAVAELCSRDQLPNSIDVTAIELDSHILPYLSDTIEKCQRFCAQFGVRFECQIFHGNFLEFALEHNQQSLFGKSVSFDLAIQNPPYGKINVDSKDRAMLRTLGLEVSNIYAGFLGATVSMLSKGGQLISVSPRSFCNGPYFKQFRTHLLSQMSLCQLHVFDSRGRAFKGDAVLQETVIMSARRTTERGLVKIVSSTDAESSNERVSLLPYSSVVIPEDQNQFIHLQIGEKAGEVAERMKALPCVLEDLGISVSTGKVVDFRAVDNLLSKYERDSVPLLYPQNLRNGAIVWPVESSKPCAFRVSDEVRSQVVPSAIYVLVKRFSSKEERRRVVAAVFDPSTQDADCIAIENHLNYFHAFGKGLNRDMATGLCLYLNSTLVDSYFRQFNGHTQVNVSDLKNLKYPSIDQLEKIGRRFGTSPMEQASIDQILSEEVLHHA